jgi:hypothetical protein
MPSTTERFLRGAASATCCVLAIAPAARAAANDASDDTIAWKFTTGLYRSSDGNHALDLNLRGTRGPHVAWIGFYRDREGLQQARTGYERHLEAPWLRTVLSAQWASGGFLGGSVTSEVGGDNFVLLGWGRTNLRSYYNLNFDPNDAITVGIGTHAIADTDLALFQVRDDRLHTGQRVTHLTGRHSWAGRQRLTVDLAAKRGLDSDGEFVTGRSWTLTYDRGPYFVRLAHDPHAGFGVPTQTRVSFGGRF